ncbi:MAG: TIR domain-containing protein [Acidobacteriia bacterium]|nr:TIR domain-containing protein [Terriglobia bacterium]
MHDLTNVFISYANEDAASAEMLADALQRAGFSIWWDRQIPPGKTWDEVIGRALDTAGCVIVLWSGTSVQSRWVREEAERAASRSCLIPALIEKVEPPLGFGRIQAADLSQWRGDEREPKFANLVRAISDLVRTTPNGAALDQRVGEQVKPAPEPHRRRSKFLWIAAPLIAVGVTFYVASQFPRAARPESEPAPPAKTVAAQNPASAEKPVSPLKPGPSDNPPLGTSSSTHTGWIHQGCQPFADPEAVVRRGPITRIDVYHAGYIHGIRIWYGSDGIGDLHGYTQRIPVTEWKVPDGQRITRVVGDIAGFYVGRLQFFTDGGQSSPQFGGTRGEPFVATDPAKRALRTISGSANLRRHPSLNRAVASMTFHFGAP